MGVQAHDFEERCEKAIISALNDAKSGVLIKSDDWDDDVHSDEETVYSLISLYSDGFGDNKDEINELEEMIDSALREDYGDYF